MKIKTLRHKATKEYIHIQEVYGEISCFTSDKPNIQPETATKEAMIEYYGDGVYIDWDSLELVDFELVECDTIGADIRNKLTPPLNLVALLNLFFKDNVGYANKDRAELVEIIKKEMKNTLKSVDYLTNIL